MHKYVLTPALFEKVSDLLAETAGLQFDLSKLSALQLHLRDRARSRHCANLEEYYLLLTDGAGAGDELRKLIELVTIHETSFFRNHEHFRGLREIILPNLALHNAATRRLRIWSAGCSTGEEPYSLAIACLEQTHLAGWDIVIEATDVSERVLSYARRGKFRADTLRYMEPDRIARWFQRQTQEALPPGARRGTGPIDPIFGQHEVYLLNERVRKLVRFSPLNLARHPYPDGYADFDLIVCENVIIYLRAEVTRAVVDEFYDRLRPGGYLFLGYSETLWHISSRFQLVTCPNTFFYHKPQDEAPEAPAEPLPLRRFAVDLPPSPREPGPLMEMPIRRPAHLKSDRTADRTAAAPPARTAKPGADLDPGIGVVVATQLVRQAQEHLEAGRYREAQEGFSGALARHSSSVDALVGLAQIHANQGRLAEARAECAKALAIDALCEEAHLLSALIARLQGDLDEAIDHFEKILYINFESIAGHYHLAELYRVQERPAEAVREYRRALWALGRQRGDKTVDGLPSSMIRQACEQQVRRLGGAG